MGDPFESTLDMTKSPNPIDRHVGARVKMRRVLLGMSQEKLGEALGITFQQVQKYEKGTNRIGASRLQLAAKILGVPVNFFFEGGGTIEETPGFADAQEPIYVEDATGGTDGQRLMAAFLRIRQPELRRRVLELVETMAAQSQP
jgi:transcriptional regulator with XRE-family HTH domain